MARTIYKPNLSNANYTTRYTGDIPTLKADAKALADGGDLLGGIRKILTWKTQATADYIAAALGVTETEVLAQLVPFKLEGSAENEDTGAAL